MTVPDPNSVLIVDIALDDCGADRLAQAAALVDQDERDRADRFRQPHHRRRFILRRAARRLVLSRVCGHAPEQLRFDEGAFGKPVLGASFQGDDLCFSAAHSNDAAIMAISKTGQLGIDIEAHDRDLKPLELARTALSPSEHSALSKLKAQAQKPAFLTAWTIKEAVLKADGRGLSLDPRRIETHLADGAAEQIITLAAQDGSASFHVQTLSDRFPGYYVQLASNRRRTGPITVTKLNWTQALDHVP